MPSDKRRTGDNPPSSRPLQPRLAPNAASARSSPATTPRLAAQYASPSGAGRRPASALGPELQPGAPSNITPRTSARKLRPESAASTPASVGTLSRTRAPSSASHVLDERRNDESGHLHASEDDARKRFLSTSPAAGQIPSSDQSHFFYANDTPLEQGVTRPPLPPKASTFVYANGKHEERRRPPSRAETAIGSPPSTMGRGPLSTLSTVPTVPSMSAPSLFRPQSPSKDNFHLTYRKGASQILRPGQSPISPSGETHARRISEELEQRRRSSIDGIERSAHQKTASLSSVESHSNRSGTQQGERLFRKESDSSGPAVTSPTIPTLRSPLADDDLTARARLRSPERLPGEHPQSPAVDGSAFQNDLAANARRERKVLDLEISNSSLLAINRSLEREVRKQKAELRRMRRMSRHSNRSVSLQSDLSAASRLSDVTEDLDEDPDEEMLQDGEPGESDIDSAEEENMSATALAQNDERHYPSDARRMKLDLTRHRDLLIDSQKLNQSIKRCLGVTEQLIRDGTRALEYQVKMHDVELGGRVLSPEEIEERDLASAKFEESYFERWDDSTRTVSSTSQLPDLKLDATVCEASDERNLAPGLTSPDGASRQMSMATTTTSEMMSEMF